MSEKSDFQLLTFEEGEKLAAKAIFVFRYLPEPTGYHTEWWLYGKLVDRKTMVDFLGEEAVARSEREAKEDWDRFRRRIV